MIEYRGNSDKLYKRDFCGEMLFGGSKEEDYVRMTALRLKKMDYSKRVKLHRNSLELFSKDKKSELLMN